MNTPCSDNQSAKYQNQVIISSSIFEFLGRSDTFGSIIYTWFLMLRSLKQGILYIVGRSFDWIWPYVIIHSQDLFDTKDFIWSWVAVNTSFELMIWNQNHHVFKRVKIEDSRNLASGYFEDMVPTSKAKTVKGGCKYNQDTVPFWFYRWPSWLDMCILSIKYKNRETKRKMSAKNRQITVPQMPTIL